MQHNKIIEPFIEQFKQNLNQVTYLLKQQSKKKTRWSSLNCSKNYLYEKNWTLVIGTQHSGKTTFLQQADLNIVHGNTEDNPECSIWFNQNGIFIELPSLSLNHIDGHTHINPFLHALKIYRKKKPFDNILLTIDMYTFIHEYDRYVHYLEILKEQLKKILSPYCSQPVQLYIVFTHMDKVAGFCDYFSAFSTQHTTQALGYLLDDYYAKKQLMEQHEKKYDRLLTRLHENLISLLHKTRNNLTRYLIREFPQQLDSLRNIIQNSISHLADVNESMVKVRGVFFTSACQSGVCVDRITLSVSQTYQLALSNHFPQAARTQPYFIKGVINMMTQNYYSEDTRFARYRREHKQIAYAGYIIAGMLLFFMGFSYRNSIQHLDITASALQQYQQLAQEENLTSLIPELHYLATARHTINKVNPWFIPFRNLDKTKRWVNTQYDKALSEQFLPQIAHKIETLLLNEHNPAEQYNALKAYLMLGEPQYLDMTYLKNWLHRVFNLASEKELTLSLLQPFPGITLDQQIIDQVRNNLNSLPIQYLTYMIIKSIPNQWIPINNDAFTFSGSEKGIPYFYTRNGFEKEYGEQIPQITQHIMQDSWILNHSITETAAVQEQVNTLYIADYLNWWRLFIYHTQPKSFNNWDEAAAYFTLLTHETAEKKISPLRQMLIFIQSNTQPFSHPNATQTLFNEHIAAPMEALNNISRNSLEPAEPILNALSHYFTMVATHNDKSVIAFNTATQKFMHPEQQGALSQLFQIAKTMPEPAGQWLTSIASHSWLLILSETKNYINQAWKNQILPEYTQKIQGRFPFDAHAELDVSLDDFSHFFNAYGTLQSFFENYLKPFLNIDKAQWSPKKINDFALPFQDEIILDFERANVIQAMFFPHNMHKSDTIPNIRFSIQAMELQPIVASVTLNIHGETLLASQVSKNLQYFNWPGDYTHLPVTLSIQSITGEKFETTEYGLWAIFKLLTHANIQSTGPDSRALDVIFDLNGNAAEYLFRTVNPVNPFTPDVIQTFQLPNAVL